jgi:hypothetical protein
MIPVLFILYTLLEYISHKKGFELLTYSRIAGKLGPLAGTLLGVLPQCGMSVFVTSLFLSKRVTMGTLIATYIATSDEAFPVLLSSGTSAMPLLALIIIKMIVGTVAGYSIDAIFRKKTYEGEAKLAGSQYAVEVSVELKQTEYVKILYHSLKRTVRIFVWVFIVTFIISIVLSISGLAQFFQQIVQNNLTAIPLAALFGLIPNCAASIALAEGFLRGGLTFGATVAGLSAGAGYGPIVLVKDGDFRTGIKVLIICFSISILCGITVSMLPISF